MVFVGLKRVMTAVELDHELSLWAAEVHDVWAHRVLPPELRSVHLSASQQRPAFPFSISLVSA